MDLSLQGTLRFSHWPVCGGGGGVSHGFVPYVCTCDQQTPSGVDTDELDSNVDDWEEETIEFFVTEEIIPLGNQE